VTAAVLRRWHRRAKEAERQGRLKAEAKPSAADPGPRSGVHRKSRPAADVLFGTVNRTAMWLEAHSIAGQPRRNWIAANILVPEIHRNRRIQGGGQAPPRVMRPRSSREGIQPLSLKNEPKGG